MKFYRTLRLLALLPVLTTAPLLAKDDPKAQARELFNAAVSAYEEQRFDEASQKFEQAYALSPAFAVLYNIGQVNAALGRPVEAIAAYEKYLGQGGTQISKDRQAEVRQEIERQRARIGTLVLRVTPTSASIQIDGKAIATSAISEPLMLVAGNHSVVAFLDGYSTTTRTIAVQARSQLELELALERTATPADPKPAPVTTPVAAPAPTPAPAPTVVISPLQAPPVTRPVVHSSAGNVQRAVGYILGGVGLVGAGVGAYVAFDAASDISSAKKRMEDANSASDRTAGQAAWDAANSDHSAALSRNRVGWIVVGAGGALFLGGIVLVATAPSGETQSALVLAPWTTGSAFGASARAVW